MQIIFNYRLHTFESIRTGFHARYMINCCKHYHFLLSQNRFHSKQRRNKSRIKKKNKNYEDVFSILKYRLKFPHCLFPYPVSTFTSSRHPTLQPRAIYCLQNSNQRYLKSWYLRCTIISAWKLHILQRALTNECA